MTKEDLPRALYSTYCKSVGGVAYNGNLLPMWEDLKLDKSKEKIVAAWEATAETAWNLLKS